MDMLSKCNIGFAITGSFCTFDKIKIEMKKLVNTGANVIPIFSFNTQQLDSRFGNAKDFMKEIETIAGNKAICTIPQAEPIGPKNLIDLLVIAPCTGNTLAKLANGITDTPVLMAAKAHMRNNRPVVISISTNDALSNSLKNIGVLMNMKNIYFVPFGQDNHVKKPYSMIAHTDLLIPTLEAALEKQQIQPIVRSPFSGEE